MNIVNLSRDDLVDYTVKQLGHFFPDGRDTRIAIAKHRDEALARLHTCINAVRWWKEDQFDYLHSTQYTIYLYFLANTIWRNTQETEVPTKLFGLNKALNGIDCFYEIELPPVFFIGHSVGIVLAKATYGNHLVLYQNVTIGKSRGIAPVIGEGVMLYPNSAIIGDCRIGDRTVVAQGTSIINQSTPGNCIAFHGESGEPIIKPDPKPTLSEIFRL